MGERAIENRIRKLKEIEAQQKALEAQADALRAEIKADMESKGVDELKTSNFIVRWKEIISNRFDSKAFQAEHEALYKKYLRQSESKRFTIA